MDPRTSDRPSIWKTCLLTLPARGPIFGPMPARRPTTASSPDCSFSAVAPHLAVGAESRCASSTQRVLDRRIGHVDIGHRYQAGADPLNVARPRSPALRACCREVLIDPQPRGTSRMPSAPLSRWARHRGWFQAVVLVRRGALRWSERRRWIGRRSRAHTTPA